MISLKNKKLELILILILSFIFCLAAIFFLINELVQNQSYFTRSFGKEQALLVEQIARQSKSTLSESTGTEQDVIEKIISKAETSGNRYWFFTRENKVLFLKNRFEMEQLRVKEVDKLLYSYNVAKGYNIDVLSTLLNNKTNGTVMFSKSKSENKILVSICFFKVNNTSYSIGMFTNETYILTAGKIVKHNTYSIMAMVLVCLSLFSTIILGMLIINKKNDEIYVYKKALHAKNMKIEELTEVSLKSDMNYYGKTKLYGKEVLLSLLKKVNRPELFPISILNINLDYSENITFEDLVLELSPELQKILPKTCVATRVQEDQLIILFLKTEIESATYFQEKLLDTWSGTLKKFNSTVQTSIRFIGQATPIDTSDDFWDMLQ